MQEVIIKPNYKDSNASAMIKQLNKGGIFLNTKEAVEIANKLEESDWQRQKAESYRERNQRMALSFVKMLLEIRSGKSMETAMKEYGISLPEKEEGDAYCICESVHTNIGTYYKGQIEDQGGGHTSYTLETYYAKSGEMVPRKRNFE